MSAPSCGAVPCGLECFSFYIDPLIDPIINTVGTSVFILKNLFGHYQTRYPVSPLKNSVVTKIWKLMAINNENRGGQISDGETVLQCLLIVSKIRRFLCVKAKILCIHHSIDADIAELWYGHWTPGAERKCPSSTWRVETGTSLQPDTGAVTAGNTGNYGHVTRHT